MTPNSTVKQSLTVEPVAYAAFADNGNIRMWCRSAIGMCELFDAHGNKAVPLYTRPSDQVAEPDAELVELLEAGRLAIIREIDKWSNAARDGLPVNVRKESGLVARIDAKLAEVKCV